MKGTAPDDAERALTRPAADDAPLSALAFKIMADKFVGSLTFLRIYRCWAALTHPVTQVLGSELRQ